MATRRYYVPADDGEDWPPELNAYNKRFAETLERIKRRHDSVVTTVGKAMVAVARIKLTFLCSPGRSRMEAKETANAD